MKAQILQENLTKALVLASRFASTKAQLPVLGNILLSAKSNKLLICSTNLEISIVTWIGAKVEKDGDITVPARVITDLVTNLEPGTVNLESEKEILKISSPKFSFEVAGMNANDFPSVPQGLGKKSLILTKGDLVTAISKVLFATSIDETRPTLTGVLFIFKKNLSARAGELVLVATDGFRLSQVKLPLLSSLGADNVILPKGVLGELGRLSETEEKINLSFKKEENQVTFEIGDIILSSRTLEGSFPDYEKIIPKEPKVSVRTDKEEFLRAVKLASVFARDSANIVKIKILKDGLEISGESQSGSQKGKVDAKVEGKVELEIAFNFRFLEEFLHAARGEEIKIELSDADKPGVFTDTTDSDFLHLIMPVAIQG